MTSLPKRLCMGLGMAVLGVGLALFVWLDVLEDRERVVTFYRGPGGYPTYRVVLVPAFRARPGDESNVRMVFGGNRGRVSFQWWDLMDPSDPRTPPLPEAAKAWVQEQGGRFFLRDDWNTSRALRFPPQSRSDHGWTGVGAGGSTQLWSFHQPTVTATGLDWPAGATWMWTRWVVFGPWFLVVVGGVWVFGMMWLVPGSRLAFWWWLGLPVRAVRGAWRRMVAPDGEEGGRGFVVETRGEEEAGRGKGSKWEAGSKK